MTKVFARTPTVLVICVVALLLGCSQGTGVKDTAPSPAPPAAVADIEVSNTKPYPFRFVAYGDLRFTEPAAYDKVIANAKARQEIIDQIVTESPAFVVATGDFVFRGPYAEDWSYFDKAFKPLRDRGVRIFPAIGNHEVGPFPPLKDFGFKPFQEIEKDSQDLVASKGLKNYFKEFPSIAQKRWYSVRYANCYFLILDSELDDEKSNAEQEQWTKAQFDAMPREIDYIFVVLHRPPYTVLTDPVHKPKPAQVALSQFVEQRQPGSRAHIVVVAGHVHNYERYQHGSVDYIVSGGGGAKPVPFTARGPDDLYPKNPLYGKNHPVGEDQFHYCVFTVDHSSLKFQMMKLVSNGQGWTFEPRDAFDVNVAAH